jgi:RNA polymerase primary sigma factor
MEENKYGMGRYIREIKEIPLLSLEEERDLGYKKMQGNEEARHKLITSNLRLVVKIAHDFKEYGLPLMDLISEGNTGMIRAVEKFDPDKGAKFSSYSSYWIKQSIQRFLKEGKTIKTPIASIKKIKKIKNAKESLEEKLGRSPTISEISNETQYSERVITNLERSYSRQISLNDHISENSNDEFFNIIPDQSAPQTLEYLEEKETSQNLKYALNCLDSRERTIMNLRYGISGKAPQTLEQVAKVIGRTRERVRQIQNNSLTKLRKMMKCDEYNITNLNGKKITHYRNFPLPHPSESIIQYLRRVKELDKIPSELNKALEALSEIEYKIINLKYIKGTGKKERLEKLVNYPPLYHLSQRQIKKNHYSAINKISSSLNKLGYITKEYKNKLSKKIRSS